MYFPREFLIPYYVAPNIMCCDIPISSTNAINMCNLDLRNSETYHANKNFVKKSAFM